MAAYRRAIEMGVDYLEIDVRGTRDGRLVAIHDSTLDRTTNGSGMVRDHSLAQILELDAGTGERVPILDDVVSLVHRSRVKLVLDIKKGGRREDRRRVVEIISSRDMVSRVLVGVRTAEQVEEFRSLEPSLAFLALVRDVTEIDSFLAQEVDVVRLWADSLARDPNIARLLIDSGCPVWVTTVDASAEELRHYERVGVSGVLLDRPELLLPDRNRR